MPPPAPSWQEAPPPVRKTGKGTAANGASPPEVPPEETPQVLPPVDPVRPEDALPEVWHDAPPPAPNTEAVAVPSKRRRARWVMAALLVLLLAVGGGVTALVWNTLAETEEQRYQLAREEFNKLNYSRAAVLFQELGKDYPDSPRRGEYQFLEEFSRTLQPAFDIGANPNETLTVILQFLKNHEEDPLLRPYRQPAKEALDKVAGYLVTEAEQTLGPPPDLDKAKRTVGTIRQALAEAKKYGTEEDRRVAEPLRAVEERIAKEEIRRAALAELRQLPPSEDGIHQAEILIQTHGLEKDADVQSVLEGLRQQVLARVQFEPPGVAPIQLRKPDEPRFAVVSVVGKELETTETTSQDVVFTAARGILYALRGKDGKFLWAARIGIDASAPPVRARDLALLISSDTNTLSARDIHTGEERWRYDLKAPCPGRPVLVDQRIFVATRDGVVHEIDLRTGQAQGSYRIGARLAGCATRQEGTSLLFVPADSLNVYVLDVDRRQCVGIFQTGHPAGSLRGEPIVAGLEGNEPVPAGQRGRRSYLILPQADGLAGTRLRAFDLETGQGVQTPPVKAEVSLRGWSWFQPYCDGEKIALATDAGLLGLFGINQMRNLDSPIFPILPEQQMVVGPVPDSVPQGRAQVVHAGENNCWVLAQGELGRWQLALDRQKGLQLSRRWRLAGLGHPLQAGQVDAAGETLFVATRELGRSTCLATAVEAESGRIKWQRRLGLVCQSGPLVQGGRIFMQDREGGLFLFDPARDTLAPDQEWRSAGRLLAPPVREAEGIPPFLLSSPGGQSSVSILSTKGGTVLEVRQQKADQVASRTFTLRQPLAGTPAVGPDYLVLPLKDGSFVWQSLEGKMTRFGPGWRAAQAPWSARGHVVHLAPDEFLTTDGLRGLTRWRWPANETNPRQEASGTLPSLIVAPPLILPENRIGVADATNTVRILKAGDLQPAGREWAINGTITGNLYRMGDFLACVVDQKRLVWLDRVEGAKREFTASAAIVGQPQLVQGAIVVADLAGKLTGVDPATGKEIGPGFTLRSGTAPAGTPVPFGEERLFVPLIDGTIMLVPAKNFRALNQ